MAEWTKATVLKTVMGATSSWVRIPLPPPVVGTERLGDFGLRAFFFDRSAKHRPIHLETWLTVAFRPITVQSSGLSSVFLKKSPMAHSSAYIRVESDRIVEADVVFLRLE